MKASRPITLGRFLMLADCRGDHLRKVGIFSLLALRKKVLIGKIGHVDVIADAGSVRSPVVLTEHNDLGTSANRGIKHGPNRVGFRIGRLSRLAIRVGHRSVEAVHAQ